MQVLFHNWLWKLVFGAALILLFLAMIYTLITLVTVLMNGVQV